MLRGILNDPDRYAKQYWSDVPGMYFTGDGARRDGDGYFWIMGRVDDVINVSGHRLGTAEIESALVSHASVAEAAVVGMPHEMKGQGIAAFVTLRTGVTRPSEELKKELSDVVAKQIGSLAKPGPDPLYRVAAQDPQRQNHAAAAEGSRRRRGGQGRRDDAGRLQRARKAERNRRGVKFPTATGLL